MAQSILGHSSVFRTFAKLFHKNCLSKQPWGSCTLSSLADDRSYFQQFKGGSVDLEKNETTGIATIILNNPSIKNAMSGQMMVELSDAVKELESWKDGKAIVMYGAEHNFCSGGDLNLVRANMDPLKGMRMSSFMHQILLSLHRLPLVSTALIQGAALGGGAELTTACDFRIMAENARIGHVQARLAVAPGWGGASRLVKLLGRAAALEILCSAKILKSQEALSLGLVNAVLPDGESFIASGIDWVHAHTQPPPCAVQAAKKMILATESVSERILTLEKERAIFGTVWGGPDHLKAMEEGMKHR